MKNQYNFAPSTRRVFEVANQSAGLLGDRAIDTEHLLLGLLRSGDTTGAALLRRLNLDVSRLEDDILRTVHARQTSQVTGRELPYTSNSKLVIEEAMRRSRELDSAQIGTEHLLFGLLCEAKGLASQLLDSRGVTLERVRTATTNSHTPVESVDADPPSASKRSLATIAIYLESADGSVRTERFRSLADALAFLADLNRR